MAPNSHRHHLLLFLTTYLFYLTFPTNGVKVLSPNTSHLTVSPTASSPLPSGGHPHRLNSPSQPVFSPTTQRVQINEAINLGTRFYQMRVLDPDVGIPPPGSLSFRIAGLTAVDKEGIPIPKGDIRVPLISQFFAIERVTGDVVVQSKVNRDIAAVVTLNISVTDVSPQGTSGQSSTGYLVITITDYNDHPPTFGGAWSPEHPEMSISIPEEQPVGTVLLTLLATDQDSDISHYEIHPPSPYFAIGNTTGVISIKKKIDFETIVKETPLELDLRTPKLPNQLRLSVFAYDSGVPQLSTMAIIHVTVLNVNDNEPVFNQTSYRSVVKENSVPGTFVAQVKASDADVGKYGKLSYSILSLTPSGTHSSNADIAKWFTINPDTGVIRVGPGGNIDREKGPSRVTIQVGVTDEHDEDVPKGKKKRVVSVPLYVSIEDVNDNPPVFTEKEYHATTVGHADGPSTQVPVIQVSATDVDEGIFGLISFAIAGGNIGGVFTIDRKTGLISVSKPPADVNPEVNEYRLVVESRDELGSGPFADQATVIVRIILVNRHKPKFLFPSQPSADFFENQKPGSKVVRVQAFDEDSGNNGVVKFSFKVNGTTNVQETDEFRIDPESGIIISKKILDREEHDHYDVILVAHDYLGQPQTFETLQHLTIVIRDVDDNKPEFSRASSPYVFSILENEQRGHLIGKVTATDKDSDEDNRKIFYHIIDGNDFHRFFLEKTTGFLFANTSFDREEQESYELVIKASPKENFTESFTARRVKNEDGSEEDLKKSIRERSYFEEDLSLAFVVVKIHDVNDNKPVFAKNIFRTSVSFKADIGATVTRVRAIDPDYGVNSSLSYTITSIDLYRKGYDLPDSPVRPIPSPFAFSDAPGEDGEIKVLQLMSQYPLGSRFVLAIEAKEKSPPFRTASSKVHIWIHDPSKLIRVTVKLRPDYIFSHRDSIEDVLSSATEHRVIITEVKYHYNHLQNRAMKDWSDLYTFVVDEKTHTEVAPQRVISKLDSSQRLHRERLLAIEQIAMAALPVNYAIPQDMDSTTILFFCLVGLICVGFVTMGIAFCCLKSWYHQKLLSKARKAAAKAKAMSVKERESRESIIRGVGLGNGDILEERNIPVNGHSSSTKSNSYEKRQNATRSPTVDNPLWTESALKYYEEQELTMSVNPADVVNDGPPGENNSRVNGLNGFFPESTTGRKLRQRMPDSENHEYHELNESDSSGGNNGKHPSTPTSSSHHHLQRGHNGRINQIDPRKINNVNNPSSSARGNLGMNSEGEPELVTHLL